MQTTFISLLIKPTLPAASVEMDRFRFSVSDFILHARESYKPSQQKTEADGNAKKQAEICLWVF